MQGTKKEANKWMVAKAQWEDCEIAQMTEVPKWLYKSYKWHKDNEIAYTIAACRFLGKEKAMEFMLLKEKLRSEYAKNKEG